MRGTDHPTESIPPPMTDRIVRWPLHNDDAEPGDAEAVDRAPGDRELADRAPGDRELDDTAPADSHADSRVTPTPATPPPPPRGITESDAPLPPAADVWYPVPVAATAVTPPLPMHVGRMEHARPNSTMATTALVTSMVALPLALVGVGAILGLVATTLGVIALVQISTGRRAAPLPNRYRGTGRAVAGTLAGIASMIIGTPILLVILMVLAIV
ncbi:MAG: DUF4190 domain-containing protein [Actinomycetota bacterium]|nr:DUF4190 domain-containing protein [Actinomycetota bacterium]